MSLQRRESAQVVSWTAGMTTPRWLGQIGNVNGLKYSYSTPGGCDQLSLNLMIEANRRTEAMDPGRILEAYLGGSKIWEGILQEPVPTPGGWQVSAVGAGNYGSRYLAAYTSMWPTSQPDEAVNNAITRGMRWTNPGAGAVTFPGAAGSATSPGAGQVLASVTMPAGTWSVDWIVGFTTASTGTAVAGDNNNFGLYAGATLVATATVDAVDNQISFYTQAPVTVTTTAGQTLAVKTIGGGTAGLVYYACIPPAGAWLGQQVDSAAQTITDLLNLCCTYGGLTWNVATSRYGNVLQMFPLPTVPDRLLTAIEPVPRSLGGDVNTIFERYEASADNSTTGAPAVYGTTSNTDTASKNRYGGQEQYIDLSQAGVMTAAAAQAVGASLMQRFQRASYQGSFTVLPGQLMTMGGQPIDLAAETSGHVCRLILTDFAYGGEVTAAPVQFLTGNYAYDDDTQSGTVTPFQYLADSLQALLGAAATMLPSAFSDQ